MFPANSSIFSSLFEADIPPSNLFSDSLLASPGTLFSFLHTTTSYVHEQVREVITTSKFRQPQQQVQQENDINNSDENEFKLTRTDYHPWTTLPIEISALICSYLTPQDLAIFAQVDKFALLTYHQLVKESSGYWKRELIRSFPSSYCSSSSSSPSNSNLHSLSLLNYLQCNLLESQMEYHHYQSLSHHYQAIYEYQQTIQQQHQQQIHSHSFFSRQQSSSSFNESGGIIGLVCDIAWTDSPLLSAVLSKKRYMTMSTILTQTIGDVHKFKKVMTNCDAIRSFLPVRSTPTNNIDPDLLRVRSNEVIFPGFIGYAVNLLRLPESLEYLRYTVFWGLFRDLMVFESRLSSQRYGRELSAEEMEKYWVVTLEDYSEEILQNIYPRLAVKKPRECYFKREREEMKKRLESRVDNGVISYSVARCTY